MTRLTLLSLAMVATGCALFGACGSDEEDDGKTSAATNPSGSSTGGPGGNAASTGEGASGGAGTGGSGGTPGMGGAPGDWACLGNVMWPAPTVATITLNATAQELQGGNPLPNVDVKACAKADVDCATPLASGTTDANGQLALVVPTGANGFDGFFDLKSPDILPGLVFVNPPQVEDAMDLAVPLVTVDTFNTLTLLTGLDPDPARGHIAMLGLDCALTEGAGLQLTASSADASSTQFYIVNMLPNQNATETDDSGAAAVFNVPAGPTKVTAVLAPVSKTTGTVDIFVRPGTVSYAIVPPTP